MPTIQTTLGALVEAKPALDRLAAERLPIKTAYRLTRLLGRVRDELKPFEAQRLAIIRQYGTKRDGSQQQGLDLYDIPPDRAAAFERDLRALVDETVTIDQAPVVLTGVETISASDLLALAPFVVVEDEVDSRSDGR